MPFASALSEHPLPTHATGEVIGQVLEQIGERPDLALVFVTSPFAGAIDDVAATVRATIRPRVLVGCTAVSVLAGPHEVEETSAVAVFAARFGDAGPPGSDPGEGAGLVEPVHLTARQSEDGWRLDGAEALRGRAGTLVLLADPRTFPIDAALDELRSTAPDLVVVGGVASAPGGNRLVLDDAAPVEGAVGVLLPPAIDVATVVSQGCRPVGDALVVTRAERNLVEEIAGQPALDRLLALAEHASPHDRSLLARGVHLGIVVDEHAEDFGRGDFLVRNVLGGDRQTRAIAVGDEVAVGTTVQFHVRDAVTADEDLRALLADQRGAAALVFTCNGRGFRLFEVPDHDARVVSEQLDGGAVAGMFCAGEIGPVGGRSFLHGFTASALLFRG